jgi:hypothetical protein
VETPPDLFNQTRFFHGDFGERAMNAGGNEDLNESHQPFTAYLSLEIFLLTVTEQLPEDICNNSLPSSGKGSANST